MLKVMKQLTISQILFCILGAFAVCGGGSKAGAAEPKPESPQGSIVVKQTAKSKLDPTSVFVSAGGEKYTLKKLKELYAKSGKVFAGELVRSAKFALKGGIPQTTFLYKDLDQIKGQVNADPKSNWTFGVYDSIGLGDLPKQTKGKTYVTFLTVDYGKELASFESSKKLLAILKSWKKHGVLSPEEFLAKAKTAGWIIKARCTDEICKESYPCQHSWEISVDSKLKGKGIPNQIRIRGNYKTHNNSPSPLKDLSGVRIYLLTQNASRDTDVLATTPWTAELEAKLRRPTEQE